MPAELRVGVNAESIGLWLRSWQTMALIDDRSSQLLSIGTSDDNITKIIALLIFRMLGFVSRVAVSLSLSFGDS